MSTDPLYPSQVCFMMPDSSNNPQHEILGSFSWFSCYNADFRAVFVCFYTTFDLIFETSPISFWFELVLGGLTLIITKPNHITILK